MRKDYYKILGLDESDKKLPFEEFKKKLKANYKKLAIQYHPDKQQGKSEQEAKTAEEKFKEIGEAYSVLSDEEKKKQYDNPNSGFKFDGFGGFSAFKDMEDIMAEFGFGSKRKSNQPKKGQDMRIVIDISLEDAFNGVTKKIKYNRNTVCKDCKGSGKTQESRVEDCSHCGGTGKLFKNYGGWQQITTCPFCGGNGKIVKNPCKSCGGNGVVVSQSTIEITIPKGVKEGDQIVMNGMGGEVPNGINGDLYAVIRLVEHEKFVRNGDDLYFELNIPVVDAILGCDISIKTIDGKTLSTKIKQGTKEGSKIRLSRKGMPIYGREGSFGDLYGVVKLEIPSKLNDDEIELLKTLREKENFKKNA